MEAGRLSPIKGEDRWRPSWPPGSEDGRDRELVPLQLPFISFSRSNAGDSIDSREVAASCWALLRKLSTEKDLYYSRRKGSKGKIQTERQTHTHTHLSLTSFKCTKKKRAENDFGESAEPHWPAQAASQLARSAAPSGGAAAMSRRCSPRTLTGAGSRCQTASASLYRSKVLQPDAEKGRDQHGSCCWFSSRLRG